LNKQPQVPPQTQQPRQKVPLQPKEPENHQINPGPAGEDVILNDVGIEPANDEDDLEQMVSF
jgi:hypothetical protein